MQIQIDRSNELPAYAQVQKQIRRLIFDKLLVAGDKLPSVRQLAKELGVSLTTIHTAYDNLTAACLIETRRGKGTYVIHNPDAALGVNLRTRHEMNGNLDDIPAMRWDPYHFQSEFFLVPPGSRPTCDLIRFTLSSPDPALFPFKNIKQTAGCMFWDLQKYFFDVGHPQGYLPLVEHLEKEMALNGVAMAEGENDIIITSGFQRALSVLLRLLLRSGQKVAIESPTYSGILNLLLAERIDYVPVPVDADGMDTEYLAGVLAQNEVRAIITIPTYHNPTGITMSPARREHLIRLAATYRIPVIEDDWGRLLRYKGEAPPPLKAIDKGNYVIHIGTFNKCFLPGLRLGWITCPADLAVTLSRAKNGADQSDSFFLQALMHEFIVKGHLVKHVRKSVREYGRRMQAMIKALHKHLPDGCRFTEPNGGFSIWVELPTGINSLPLLTLAREAGVDFLPAPYCRPDRQDAPALRLSFSRSCVEDIQTGIERLCAVIKRCIDQPSLLTRGTRLSKELK